ncbi:unnamed protein product [Arabidopsis halleri]
MMIQILTLAQSTFLANKEMLSLRVVHRSSTLPLITVTEEAKIVYFLSSYGTIVACDLTKRCFTELPKLLPPVLEYSIDLVECNGTMYVFLLSEFFESASLRIWRLDNKREWVQVEMLPPALSHELEGLETRYLCASMQVLQRCIVDTLCMI